MSIVRKPRAPVLSDAERAFAADVLAGLAADPKHLPPKYFYDRRGSELFERITTLPEYYPTRIEIGILEAHAGAIAKLIPGDAAVVEFGAGSAAKTRILLRAAPHVSAYVPVDISGEFLASAAQRLRPHIADWFEVGTFPAREIAPELGKLGLGGFVVSAVERILETCLDVVRIHPRTLPTEAAERGPDRCFERRIRAR